MEFLELAKKRYSVRKFDERKVEEEKIKKILQAGKIAPTANNCQPQRIYVLSTKDNLNRLKTCTPYHFNAPLALLVCYDNVESWKRKMDNEDIGIIDASIVATHMMLQVTEMGLGSTWVGYFDPLEVQRIFSLPPNIVPVAILPIGYPSESSKPLTNHTKRYEISETVIFDNLVE